MAVTYVRSVMFHPHRRAYSGAAMQSRIRMVLSCGMALAALAAGAQARKIHEYRLHEPEDRGSPFAMTVGPDHTLYTLVPRHDGNWVLSEVQGWWLDHPDEHGILVEGFSSRDPVAAPGQMDLAVTPDGKFLVAVLSASMRVAADDPYPVDMIVEVTRLDHFEVMNTEHLRGLGIRGNLQAALDRTGHLLVSSSVPAADENGAQAPYVTWFRLTPPELKADLLCSYQAPADAKNAQPIEDACSGPARTEGYASAAEILALFPQKSAPGSPSAPPPPPPSGVSVSSKDRFQAATVTIDGKPLTVVVLNGIDVQVYAMQ
jgi:hypothetical protein